MIKNTMIKLTKRHQQILAAIEQIGRPCSPWDIRPILKAAGFDIEAKSISDSCKTLANKGLLDYHRGDLRTKVLYGLPGVPIPEDVDRTVKRRASWGYGPGPGRGGENVTDKEKPRTIGNAVSHKRIEDDQWMTVDEVMTYLKASERQIRDMVYRRRIPHTKLGRLLRFHRPTIDKWMLSNSK